MENSPVHKIRRAQEVLNSMVPDCDEVTRGETRQDKLKELIRTQQWPHLDRDMRTQLQQVVMNHDALFVLGPNEIGTIKGLPANIPLVNEQPVRGPQYRYPEKAKELTMKQAALAWTDECQTAFETLKRTSAFFPVLVKIDMDKPFGLHSDASNFCVGASLNQLQEDGSLRPVGYFSRKLKPAETWYSTTDQEAVGIVLA
ncbi:uncharacterized protein LOC121856432, partial [Homarus americanus]|uniref:uncharacterized protein LOC121856432 n=1 Tax=Homarus americanus TaxID=6706 RepID=UPI001C454FC1